MANLSAGSVTIDFLGRNTALTRTFSQVERQMNVFSARIQGSFSKVSGLLGGLGFTGITAGLASVVAAFGFTQKAAADFEKAMAKVSTLLEGPAMAWMPVYAEGLRNLSTEVGESVGDLADTLF